ncbi:MAG: hypothetical protein IT379_35530, partial [Deltaproteobacteria bacterium]|nr:hypothetical protein [Deltaproteobacteria bacterium]
MTIDLRPCPSCRRHARPTESCPFCGASLDDAAVSPALAIHRVRARAAVYLGAALMLTACGDDDGTTDGGTSDTGIAIDATGPDLGGAPDTGPADTGPPDTGPEPDFGVFPPYGTP